MADNMTGCTVTHGTTSYAAEIIGLSGEVSRAVMDSSHMGTTGARTKVLGDLYDAGAVRVRCHFDPDEEAPYTTAAETVTITFPVPSGLNNGATVAGSGGVTQFTWGADSEALGTAEYTITWTDDLTWTDASA